jgi:hypothetical protein
MPSVSIKGRLRDLNPTQVQGMGCQLTRPHPRVLIQSLPDGMPWFVRVSFRLRLEGYRRQIDQRIIPALGRIPVRRLDVQASEGRLPGSWLRWVALAPQCPMSRIAASTTQNQSQPLSPRPGVYSSR